MNKQLVLPKLTKINLSRPPKKKILLLSDDLRMHSGIATMSREFVVGTADTFDWIQLGAALEHPDAGKVFDVSMDVNQQRGIDHASVKVYASTGYGNAEVLRELIGREKPDAILHFTDPRFWDWLYAMEHEIRSGYKIPILYYNIWDSPPAPFWNKPFYESCDLLMNISKQTNTLVKMVLGEGTYTDIRTGEGDGPIKVCHVPHGINPDQFFPITPDHADYKEYMELKNQFKTGHDVDFVIFWNNRNIRRKMMGDLVLAYKAFCDRLPKEKAKRVGLFMHTAMRDPNGTDIPEVVRVMCPDYKVIFNEERLPTRALNMFYNIADVTVNIASNEGFGLSSAESIMAGTPILNNVTGGLQDQVRFENTDGTWLDFTPTFTSNHTGIVTEHGSWAKVVYPTNRSLQGSVLTPYIFDDRCDFEDVADKLLEWYNTPDEVRKQVGLEGRAWMLSEESGMSSNEMCNRMKSAITTCLDEWKPKYRYELLKTTERQKITEPGVVYRYKTQVTQ
jgi:glycosyltransferase involved in cell wall biosynthesis